MQIAVDGPAGAGKSTIAKIIAKEYQITYLDTGAMYRSIANEVLVQKVDFSDEKKMIELTRNAKISFRKDRVFCNHKDVTEAIRTPEVSMHTSKIACIKEIRELLVEQQREIADSQSVIMDGRDIGSVVLPKADFKFYLDADVTERGIRRLKEFEKNGLKKTLSEIKEEIQKRDDNDQNRVESPLVKVEDAIVIDTTGKTIKEVCEIMKSYINGKVEK
ncbi:MAG: (d)CMP kinase [Eubacteriaceae bacterium]